MLKWICIKLVGVSYKSNILLLSDQWHMRNLAGGWAFQETDTNYTMQYATHQWNDKYYFKAIPTVFYILSWAMVNHYTVPLQII